MHADRFVTDEPRRTFSVLATGQPCRFPPKDGSEKNGAPPFARITRSCLAGVTVIGWALLTASLGCRTPQNSALVRVSKEPQADRMAVPAPEQRLAKSLTDANRRVPQDRDGRSVNASLSDSLTDSPTQMQLTDSSDTPPVRQTAHLTASRKQTSEPKPTTNQDETSLVSASLSDHSPSVDQTLASRSQSDDPNVVAKSETLIPKHTASSTATRRTIQSGTPDPMPTTNTTNRPHSLADALRASLENLPELPPPSEEPTDLVPTRLAAVDQLELEQSDDQPLDELTVAEVHVGELPAKTAEAVANPATDNSPSPVRPVAHEVMPEERTEEDSQVALASLNESQLYDLLLQKLLEVNDELDDAERERRGIIARYLLVLAGDPDRAGEVLDGLDEREQKYLSSQLKGLWTMIDPQGHPSSGRRISEALPRFREATQQMAAETDTLDLKNLEFCTEIESFGQIKPFPGNRFKVNQEVILYCEIENFVSKKTDKGFETHLQGTYDVFDSEGQKVISQLLPADQQVSRRHLRDYFVAYLMSLPKQLTAGTYRMQLTVEDVNGKKYGQASIPLEIAE